MAVSVVPALIDTLCTVAKAALEPAVRVLDGPGVTDDPGDFLMVGVDDPNNADSPESGRSQTDWAALGQRARNQVGDITCAALAWNGDGNQKAARDAAYSYMEVLAALCTRPRQNPDCLQELVPGVIWAVVGDDRLTQDQYESGVMALVVFSVHFTARI